MSTILDYSFENAQEFFEFTSLRTLRISLKILNNFNSKHIICVTHVLYLKIKDNQLLVSFNISKLSLEHDAISVQGKNHKAIFISLDIHAMVLFYYFKANRHDNLIKLQVPLPR